MTIFKVTRERSNTEHFVKANSAYNAAVTVLRRIDKIQSTLLPVKGDLSQFKYRYVGYTYRIFTEVVEIIESV